MLVDFYGCKLGPDLAMLDYFLKFAGIEPRSVPRRFRRNRLQVEAPRPSAYNLSEMRTKFDRLIALNANASTPIRCMPKEALGRLLGALDRYPRWGIVTTHAVGRAGPRILDVSYRSRTFPDFVAILACCDGAISVDSSTYHIADALDMQALVFFTTNKCDVWTANYPRAIGVQVGSPGPLGGMHFSNDPLHIAYARAQWAQVDFSRALAEFRGAIERSSADRPGTRRLRASFAVLPSHNPGSSETLAIRKARPRPGSGGRTRTT